MRRYFIGLFIALGLIILLIILLLSGGKKSNAPTKKLYDYASTDAQVSVTIDGPINAASLHQQIRIIVDNTNVTYEQIQGYDGNVVDTHLYANTENSYNAFLHALRHAGFSAGDNNPALSKDGLGYCPTGQRYIFELTQDDNNLQKYWNTSCGGGPKTYLGNTPLTLTLFRAQVPDYNQLTNGLAVR